jgi:hypothetical protein
MFGQFADDPLWVPPGVPDGAVVLGAVDGAGLAAETAATPPPTSSSAEIAPVRTIRRRPVDLGSPAEVSTGGAVAGGADVCAGTKGWKAWSIFHSFRHVGCAARSLRTRPRTALSSRASPAASRRYVRAL